jgi:hypothetical protein
LYLAALLPLHFFCLFNDKEATGPFSAQSPALTIDVSDPQRGKVPRVPISRSRRQYSRGRVMIWKLSPVQKTGMYATMVAVMKWMPSLQIL